MSSEDDKQLAMGKLGGGPLVQWKERAEKLWQLLDDIDTLSDIFKDNEPAGFHRAVLVRVAKRHKILESDGHHLFVPGTLPSRELELGTLAAFFKEEEEA